MLVYDLFKVISTDLKRTHVSGTWDLNLSSERWIQYLAAATHQSRSFCRIVWHVSQAHHIGTRVTAAPWVVSDHTELVISPRKNHAK